MGMWALRLVAPSQFESIVAPELEPSALGDGDVLLKVLAGGLCGSDLPKFRGIKGEGFGVGQRFTPGAPGFPMHEVVGEVLASRHRDVRVGDKVVGWARDSLALAELAVVDGDQVHRYAPGLTPDSAVLLQPLACVLYALDSVASAAGQHETAAVLGLGPIGLLFAHVLKKRGAQRVIGVDPVDRSEQAALFGMDDVVPLTAREWVSMLDPRDRPALVVEAVGHQEQTLNDAIHAVAIGGTVLHFGIPDDDYYSIDVEQITRKNVHLVGGITRDRRTVLAAADRYLEQHPDLLDAIVTHRFGRDQVQHAYDLACVPARGQGKIVVRLD